MGHGHGQTMGSPAFMEHLLHKRILFASRINAAQTVKRLQKTAVSLSPVHLERGLARIENRTMLIESEVQAARMLSSGAGISEEVIRRSLKEETEQRL
ncbi:PspA/IM30 family protein [Peribacillus sp. SCS-37]|uniref:PspA/IM30 family protein n=1 Tax=Paraperibacillus esterisolvens TaxID=3115296 RepID=UPI0039058FC6